MTTRFDMDPSRVAEWERAFDAMPLEELAELRRVLVVVLVRRRLEQKGRIAKADDAMRRRDR